MGVITSSTLNFKSAEYIYSKIKREFKSFDGVNLIDDADFPLYTAEVLKELGVSSFKEEEAVLFVKNGQACLPSDFMYIHAAYKVTPFSSDHGDGRHFQNQIVLENDVTCETLSRQNKCLIDCQCTDKLIEKVTIRQYVNDSCSTYCYSSPTLLKLGPNVKQHLGKDSPNIFATSMDEISINDRKIFTNFNDGDVYLQYYAFPLDENGMPMIPDLIQVEKAVEWFIKYQILLNFWMVDDIANAQAKWGKAEQIYLQWLAEARYINKLPSFAGMVNYARMRRGINAVSFFSQTDRKQ